MIYRKPLVDIIFVLFVGFLFSGCNQQKAKLPPSIEVDQKVKDDIKSVISNSQNYEIELYIHPDSFQEADLAQYWVPDVPGLEAKFDWFQIKNGLQRLKDQGLHYGEEVKDTQTGEIRQRAAGNIFLDVKYINVYNSGFAAEVETHEKWFIPIHNNSHQLIKTKNIYLGPYEVKYHLIQVNNKWLIVSSNTPRIQPSTSSIGKELKIVLLIAIALVILFVPPIFFLKRRKRLSNEDHGTNV